MKRMKFSTPEELEQYCLSTDLSLVVEFKDEHNKQRQVTLQKDALKQAKDLLKHSTASAYFRHEGMFYEVVAEWK